MSTVFTGTIARALKLTLEQIVTDKNYQSKMIMPRWLEEMNMKDNFEDDVEYAGPGLIAEKTEGAEISTGTLIEGYTTRYNAKTFALKLIVTDEALEDNKYPRVIQAAKRLNRALYKTVDIDSTNILVRMFNASFVGGDGLPLGSNAHTLPHGGTFSNIMATPMSPSMAAVVVATSACRKFPGHDGVTEGYEPRKILCPTEQWGTWCQVLNSVGDPKTGEFNAVNVVNYELGLGTKPVANQYWNNTTTNWAMLTEAEYGLNFRWRRKPRSRTWVDNDQELMKYAVSARWARGWSDPRAIFCVNA